MSRTKAIEWLFWHHAREGWNRFHANPNRPIAMGIYLTFPLEPPGADNCWLRWVLG